MNPRQWLVAALLFLASDAASGLKCYLCTGALCVDPFNATMVQEMTCTVGSDACAKSKTKTDGVVTVARTCFASGGQTGCTSGSAGGSSAEVCFCSTDLCNSVTGGPQVTATLMMICALIPAFLDLPLFSSI